jgi:CheY-like chemotaxis protein
MVLLLESRMRRYLVVDDNAAFAENLAEIFTDAGAEATIAHSGQRALAAAQETRFDVVVSDMRMPSMGGAELVHRLRRIDPGLPAIIVSAYTADDDLDQARQQGLLATLPKPVPLTRMLELVTAARRNGLIALIEDDCEIADLVTEALRSHGFATVTAHSVLETERLGIRPFCGVVDLRVPGGADGEAMRRLAAKYPGLPLIVTTAYGDRPPPLPCAAILTKPFDTQTLIRAVERLHC